jgi:hypothetical protein
MAQTTAATSSVASKVEVYSGGQWVDVSGSTNQVNNPEQARMSGEGYTFTGDTAIVKGGKREPIEVGFRCIYTEEAAEAFEILRGYFEATGGTDTDIRWTVKTKVFTITDGVVTRLQYPAADATDANPVMCEFSVRTGALGVA